jgi:hypothetical protein
VRTLLGRRNPAPLPADELAAKRADVARRCSTWHEITDPERLRPRGPGLLVDAETDLVWTRRRGHVFEPGGATIAYAPPGAELTFYVDHESGEPVFLERALSCTWSEHLARQEARRP